MQGLVTTNQKSLLFALREKQREEQKIYRPFRIMRFALFFGGLYFLYIALGGVGFVCPLHFFTGYQCPGCGITTMIMNLLTFHFHDAYLANPYLFISLPIVIPVVLLFEWKGKGKKKWNIVYSVFLSFYIVSLFAWGVLRNLPISIFPL